MTILHPLEYYIKKLDLEKGRKIYYYNVHHNRYEEWYYFDAVQNKSAFYNKDGKQVVFNSQMLNNCARTLDECRLIVYKLKEKEIIHYINRQNTLIKKAQEDISRHKEKIKKFQKILKKEQKAYEDVITKYPEEFI